MNQDDTLSTRLPQALLRLTALRVRLESMPAQQATLSASIVVLADTLIPPEVTRLPTASRAVPVGTAHQAVP